jgi:hypothetical protein
LSEKGLVILHSKDNQHVSKCYELIILKGGELSEDQDVDGGAVLKCILRNWIWTG